MDRVAEATGGAPLLTVELVPQCDDTVAVVRVIGEVDLSTVAQLSAVLHRLRASRPRAVACDLRRVSFLAAAGVHCLESAMDELERAGATFCVVSGERQLPVFAVLGPSLRWPTHLGVDEAVRSVAPR